MTVEEFFEGLRYEFFTGVPDSTLSPICDYLMRHKGLSKEHIIAANEGNCVGLAAGYYMATGKVPVIYLQNSGIGNLVNPIASLLNEKIYRIPCLFLVGWRGEPGVHDEPQHLFQGEITHRLLEDLGVHTFTVSKSTTQEMWQAMMAQVDALLAARKQAAIVISKGAITADIKGDYGNSYSLMREKAISQIVAQAPDDIFVASTGKIARELFAVRETLHQDHAKDFLTVGSMGHCSSIALEIALQKPERRVWCLDGDGALLMHMGAMAVIGSFAPANMVHVVFNNESHESVGGYPTAIGSVDLCKVAQNVGYQSVHMADTADSLQQRLAEIRGQSALTLLEIRTAIGSRADLGRPTISPEENMKHFMLGLQA